MQVAVLSAGFRRYGQVGGLPFVGAGTRVVRLQTWEEGTETRRSERGGSLHSSELFFVGQTAESRKSVETVPTTPIKYENNTLVLNGK